MMHKITLTLYLLFASVVITQAQVFTAHSISSSADGPNSVYAMDMDGDGDMDVLGASENDDKIAWYENNGAQTFTSHTISVSADIAVSVYATDMDSDGDIDVLSASYNDDKIAWYENGGSQNFTAHTVSTSADGAYSVYAADIDGDGDMDMLSASANDNKIAWYENDGSQNFTSHIISSSVNSAVSVYGADMDGDGDIDVLSAAELGDEIAWYENDGSPIPSFTPHSISTSVDGAFSVYATDMDGDGDMDVLSASYNDDKIAWYENDGAQNFTAHSISTSADHAVSVYAIDMDGDSDMDVLSTSTFDNKIAWYENDGAQNFTAHSISTSANAPFSVYASDIDGDGDMDVLSASRNDDQITWYEASPPPVVPILTTNEVTDISSTHARGGGTIDPGFDQPVQEAGVCYSTSPDPVTSDNKGEGGAGMPNFISFLNNLSGGTTYYVRAYIITESDETIYGNEVTFTTLAPVIPVLSTSEASSVTASSAVSGGNISSDGGAAVTASGVCWSTSLNPTTADNKTTDGTGTGSFSSNISGLSSGTTYYVRAYATNSVGTAYGIQKSFTTLLPVPVLTTDAASSITVSSAVSGGNITDDNGFSVTERGVCWSTSSNPTTADSKTTDGSGTGSFTSNLGSLLPGTTYYIRAYAVNSAGTGYGNEESFTTSFSLSTSSVSSITASSAVSGGTLNGNLPPSYSLQEEGICYSTSPGPVTADNKEVASFASGDDFTVTMDNLVSATTYYARAYIIVLIGGLGGTEETYYGDELSFTTLNLPSLSTLAVTSVTSSTASSGGNITDDGGNPVTARGVCWSTSSNPTIADSKTSDGTGTGSFSSSLGDLSPGTTYYVRAYATSSAGTAYGDEKNFTSSAVMVSLTTSPVSSITASAAISGGDITDNGGSEVTARGVCWSTSPNPTIADSKTSDGTGTGSFTSALSGLTTGTTYYVRAYATNSAGTAYGNEECFTAEKIILSITGPSTSLALNSAPVTFTATPAGGTWSGGGIAADGTFDPAVSGIGTKEIQYTYINGCTTWDTSITVRVYPATEVTVAVSREAVCPGGATDLSAACNQAIEFDGSSYIRFDQAAASIANSDFTFSAWVKLPPTSSDREIFAINTSSGGNRILMPYKSNGTVNVYDDVKYYPSNAKINDAKWHHVAYTYNKASREAKIYIDGVLDKTYILSNMSATGVASDDRLSLGQEWDNSSTGDFLIGSMDEARLWNTLLTGSEINSWMHQELNDTHPQYDHLVAYYNFNVPGNSAYDYSENFFTGTVHGSPDFVASVLPDFEDPCTYSWTSDPAGFSASDSMVTVTPSEPTEYSVVATGNIGGSATGSATVKLINLSAPEIFSSPLCEGSDLHLFDRSGGGNALSFDGSNDWVELDALAGDIAGKDFTVSFWMKQTGTSGIVDLFAINTSSNGNRILLEMDNATGVIDIYSTGSSSARTVNDGNWHHIAMSLDQSEEEATVYIDGNYQFTAAIDIPVASDKVSLAQEWDSSPSNFFKGQLDELRIYKTARSQPEIVSDMLAELGTSDYSNLYAYYKLNESSGTAATDVTGNGNDGNKKDGTATAEGPAIVASGWRTHSWTGPNSFTSTESDPVLASATASAAGTYSLIVDVLGCSAPAAETTVTVNPTLDPGISPAGPFCSGAGKDTLQAASPGGTWSGDGIIDVNLGIFDPSLAGPGTHTITYTANDCAGSTDNTTVIVYESPQLSVSSANASCAGCADGSVSVSVTGGQAPYSYDWAGGCVSADCNGLIAGDYAICVTDDHTCHVCDTVTVSFVANSAPVINDQSFSIDENSINGASVGTVTASDADAGQTLSYAITAGNTDNVFGINSSTGEITVAGTLDYETTSSYTLTVEVTDDGTSPLTSSASITIDINDVTETGISNASAGSRIHIYPNPSAGQFTINTGGLSLEGHMVRVLNAMGETVYQAPFNEQLDLTQLAKGVYTLMLENENGVMVKQVVIR